jgi:hypothetical protein
MGVEQQKFSSSKLKNFGYRIYKLKKDGILFNLGLKELEDFIIPPENLINKNLSFIDWLKLNKDNKITLRIFSILKRNFRTIEINNNNDKILGATIRFENYINAIKKVLHVIKIKENSFSQLILKLEENNDYLIAIKPEKDDILSLNSKNDITPLDLFTEMIKFNIGKECEFYIYNSKNGARFVKCKIPDDEFFELGCNVAYGKIHEFPIDENEDKTQINGNLINI